MHKDLTWASHATSVKIPPQFLLSPGLNFYWHRRFMYIFSPLTCQNFMKQSSTADPFMRQCYQASSSFRLDCGGGDSEVSSSTSHCRTRLLAQQRNTIVFTCVPVGIGTHSSPVSRTMTICILVLSPIHVLCSRCSSLSSFDNKCLTSYSSTDFSRVRE